MLVKQVNGTVIVSLLAEDCSVLAEALAEVRHSPLYGPPGMEARLAHVESLGAAFAGLALASASDLCLTPRSRSERRDYLTRLGMLDLVGEYG